MNHKDSQQQTEDLSSSESESEFSQAANEIMDILNESDGIFSDEDMSNDWIDEISGFDESNDLFESMVDSHPPVYQDLTEQEDLNINTFWPDPM